MITYNISEKVLAFTAGREEELPCEVTQAQQVHGLRVARVDRPGLTKKDLDGYDALITDVPGLAIGVRTADCIPLLMYDPVHRAVAAVHSGWKGTVKRIVRKAIYRMHQEYSTEARDLQAVIGPGICAACFQVGEEVVEMFRDEGFPLDEIYSWRGPKVEGDMGTGHHLDLFAANRRILLQEGVRDCNISISGICTYEDIGLYSARREESGRTLPNGERPKCGRNINAIMLR